MKASRYNYIVEKDGRAIFFNGITELFFDIPIKNRVKYEEILSHPDRYSDTFGMFIAKMKSNGFIVDDEIDEQGLLEQKYLRLRRENEYHLMILPTYQCNLRCWYCVQDHQDLTLKADTIEEIKRLLTNIAGRSEIDRLRLSWFGGEPLLAYDTVLALTEYCRELFEKNGKVFLCDITTNGTLLNRERIEQLCDAGVSHYQITIDGTKEIHDNIKILGKLSAFEKSLETINIITNTTPCTLRFNYTKDNLDPIGIVKDLKERIKKENRHNLSFLIYKVWQEDAERIDFREVEKLASLSSKEGIIPQLPTVGLCYADAFNFNCIFPNGRVEKCDNESPNTAKGCLVNGEIIWEGDITTHTPAFRNSQFPCSDCKYVPICWGPCVAKRDRMLRNEEKERCEYSDKDSKMREILLNKYINDRNIRTII